jgi:antitoxin component YwqK of YwqJK toxin-antitoxin module
MKTKLLLLLTMAIVLGTSCGEDGKNVLFEQEEWRCGTVDDGPWYRWSAFLYPAGSKLKRVYQVDPDCAFARTFEEYEYDGAGRIAKIVFSSSGKHYDEYTYNAAGQLVSVLRYGNDELERITSFVYDASGNRIREDVENRTSESSSHTLFVYGNNRLVKTEHYENGRMKFYKLYEYGDSGELLKEKLSVPDEDGCVTTEHLYAEGLLVHSFSYNEDNREGRFLYEKKYYYDLNGNMTLKVSNMPGLSSAVNPDGFQSDFIEKRVYEYEK